MDPLRQPLKSIASTRVIAVGEADTLGEAARRMAQHRVSCVPVLAAGRHPLGVVSETRLLAALREGVSLQSLARDVVVVVPVVSGEQSCEEGWRACRLAAVEHLLLADEAGGITGVVSQTDFRIHLNLAALAGPRAVQAVMAPVTATLSPQQTVGEALLALPTQAGACRARILHLHPERRPVPVAELPAKTGQRAADAG